jgi:hypothetical protein
VVAAEAEEGVVAVGVWECPHGFFRVAVEGVEEFSFEKMQ